MVATTTATQLQFGDHVCVVVDDAEESLDVTAQVVAAGLAAGDKVMVFTEVAPSTVVGGLLERGVPVASQERTGQLRVVPARDSYLPTGRFEPAQMIDALVRHVDHASREGYPGLRLVGDMSWVQADPSAIGLLASYESQVSRLYLDGPALGVCLYDRHAFGADLLQQVACNHPATIVTDDRTDWTALLRIRRVHRPYGLRLTGEADFSNRQAVAEALGLVVDQLPDPAVPIVVDMAGVRFLDAGTAALLGTLAVRAPAGVHFTGCRGVVATVFDCLGLIDQPQLLLSRAGDSSDSVGREVTA